MILSIIVPAYNVEKYIVSCLESILCQIDTNSVEVIVVNDGSTDNTVGLIEHSFETNKFLLIHQNNQGLSAARNKGLMCSKGRYVWFVDSDDTIKPNSIKNILDAIELNTDVIAIGYDRITNDCITSHVHKSFNNTQKLLESNPIIPAQFYIYRREFLSLNNLSFNEGIYHEDMEFTPRMLFLAKSICFIDKPLYNYYQRENSITTSANPKKSFDLIIVAKSLDQFKNQHRVSLSFFDYIISQAINNAFKNIIQSDCSNNVLTQFNGIIGENKYLLRHYWKSKRIMYRIEYLFFSTFPGTYTKVYSLFYKLCH